MMKTIELDGIAITLTQKKVKYLRITVQRPHGEVKVSAPLRMPYKKIFAFIQSKLAWIRQHQLNLQEQGGAVPAEYVNDEIHSVWGKPYLLRVSEHNKKPAVEIQENYLTLKMRPAASREDKQKTLDKFYRQQLEGKLPEFINKWEAIMKLKVETFSLQKMKTRWGVCKPSEKHIKFNTELAKKPIECLEYVVVHEIVHFIEASHNHRFKALMDEFMPSWRLHRKKLI